MPTGYTRLVDHSFTDSEFRKLYAHIFPARKAAAVAVWLAHQNAPCTGEIFETGGGHVRRVLLAATAGRTWHDLTPEALVGAYDAVADPATELCIPADTNTALQSIIEKVG